MHFSGKLALKVGAVGIAAGAILAPVAAAHAATPAITVTPSTGLTNGESVTVAGTGFTAGATIAVLECSGAPDATGSQCDISALSTNTATANASGGFSKTITVKTGTIGSGTCAATSTNCLIEAGNEGNTAENASEPISFGGTTPPGPAITVTPSTGVKTGDTVQVSGTGFPASMTVNVLECGGSTGVADCDLGTLNGTGTTDATGAFHGVAVKVHTGAVGDKTCNAGDTCDIIASTSTTTQDATNTAIGTFTFAAAAGTGASITLTPSTNVKNGGSIVVTGTGFPKKAEPAYIVECGLQGKGQDYCDTANVGFANTKADGTLSFTFTGVHTGALGTKGSCKAGGQCSLTATTDTSGTKPEQSATATFTFATGGGTTGRAATKTKAAYSSKKHAIGGVVTSKGTGIKGLKTKLEIKKGSHWKAVASGKTHASGVFTFKHVTKSGTYEVKTLKNAKYKGSTSNKIKV